MLSAVAVSTVLIVATFPFIYYLIALYSSWKFFDRRAEALLPKASGFYPPISNLKPVRGLDPDAYENFASFCRQDYPEYEVVFCVGDHDDPALPVIKKLQKDFPDQQIRVLFGSGRMAVNDKVAKLARLANEATYEHLVISDSDVRVQPDYLRSVISPLSDPAIGAVTCLYVSTGEKVFVERLQSTGMISDFYASLLVAKQLDGVKFALGPTIATTRARLSEFGGYESIENRPGDDLWVGRLISDKGYQIELSRYTVETVADYQTIRELIYKRLRWLVVMRHMRPWGHSGLIFTQGLLWSIVAIAVHPTAITTAGYLSAYFLLRFAMGWSIGVWGLKRDSFRTNVFLFPVWDLLALSIWLTSFARNTIRWRGGNYYIRNGNLIPVEDRTA